MCRFYCRDYSLCASQFISCIDSFVVINAQHLCPASLIHITMHWSHTWIVKSGRDSESLLYLSVLILHHEHLCSMQYACSTFVEGGSSMVCVISVSTCFCQYYLHSFIVDVMVYGTSSITAASDTSNKVVRIVTSHLFLQLVFQFFRDDALHSCYNIRIRVRTHRRADKIVSVAWMTAPVSDSSRTSIRKCHVTCPYRIDLSTQHLHTLHIGMLTFYISSTHENLTFHIHQRTDGSSCHTMLSSSCLSNNACLTHLLGKQYLSYRIIYFMGTCMIEVFTLQV